LDLTKRLLERSCSQILLISRSKLDLLSYMMCYLWM